MSEHEFWNELGNLYFISGAYEPAIHAYARSIELDRGYGRPYSNMALAFVHSGKYQDAIELYHRSIELLTDPKEKAITWNRLGILYRQIKDYQGALIAYEQADKLDSRQDDKREEASRDVKYPLSVTMPPIDLQAILERRRDEEPAGQNLLPNVDEDERRTAGTQPDMQWFDGDFVPPNPDAQAGIDFPMAERDPLPDLPLSVEEELLRDISISMVEEGWIPLNLEEAIPFTDFQLDAQPAIEEAGEVKPFTDSWPQPVQEPAGQGENQAGDFAVTDLKEEDQAVHESASEAHEAEAGEAQTHEEVELPCEHERIEAAQEQGGNRYQWVELSGDDFIGESVSSAGAAPVNIAEARPEYGEVPPPADEDQISGQNEGLNGQTSGEGPEDQPVFEHVSIMVNEFEPAGEAVVQTGEQALEAAAGDQMPGSGGADAAADMGVTGPEAVEYSQVEYPLVELTPAEVESIEIDIARFRRIVQINPRNAFAWDTLGGLYKSLGKFKEAITSYQQAIALDSGKPAYYYQLGLMYSAERRDQEAMDAFQQVLTLNPNHTLAHASLGSYYRKMGLSDLAQHHIDIALKDVYEEENEYNQACLEAICGNTDRALELLQVAIEDHPSYINWAQHDPDLDALRHDQRYHILIQQHAPAR